MKKLQTHVHYFVFSDDLKSTLTLHDHRYFTDPFEASAYVRKLNSTSRQERSELGWSPDLRFECRSSSWIKERPEYQVAFKKYFGPIRIETPTDPDGKPLGAFITGVPQDLDLTKCDLGRIADDFDKLYPLEMKYPVTRAVKAVKSSKKPGKSKTA